MEPSGLPTLQDVSRVAGVSTATVSRCINDPSKVARKTREQIQKAIDELGYTPNFGGRVLASRRTNSVGVVIPTMDNAMFAGALQAFQEVLTDAGKTLLVASSGYDPAQEFRQIRALVANGADGLLLIGTDRPQDTRDFLARRRVPHVLTWCFEPDSTACIVGFDNRKAGRLIAEAALALGHRNVAIIGGISRNNDRAAGRMAGMRDALAAIGPPARITRVVETRYGLDQGGDAFDVVMQANSAPTAVLCGNDVLATGAILRARDRGIRVPQDVSITGIDDHNLARVVAPALTTVRVPQREMGRQAARVLLGLIAGDRTLRGCEVEVSLVRRQSLAGPPPGG
ncbi:LacI family DNA-binding transcriptional regulator [Sedimentitalea sp. JM2-8]|uniref:LacI family DNA-binding transcriptional regulator n=1 Tax=Sedimentitalea xiamensis TaxID=3050037 RepID=A0ABT7FE92_9RHOB|nr:LacI family DNA-binding transcriptional regulator [Sedimentitalea xiamensis]MDK3073308.1 LacI family DNA-binding transcriptional regulator [Sedimentitalea xiamensis]